MDAQRSQPGLPGGWRVAEQLKHDVFGRVELLVGPAGRCVRRVACGNGWPLTRLIARLLQRRERRALVVLAGCAAVPQLLAGDCAGAGELLRTWCDGEPLWSVRELRQDFFDRLREVVIAVHARQVCHNDLHKENNILVGPDGHPRLVDFQLASVHPRGGARFRRRCAEDLRHVEKHRRRYEPEQPVRAPAPRSLAARLWRRCVKPIYNVVTRRILRLQRGEPRRPPDAPLPVRTPPRD